MLEIRPYVRKNVSYNPYRDLADFGRSFGFPFDFFDKDNASIRTDISDAGDSYLLEADLPGFSKEDIKLSVDGDLLTITAERHSAHEEKDKKDRYVRCERSYGSYTRQFDVSEVDVDKIGAKYEDGVLKLTMPKKPEPVPTARQLAIE